MLRKLKIALIPAALVSLVLAGCGTAAETPSPTDDTSSVTPSDQATEETPAPVDGAEAPMPEVSGTFGTDAALIFPAGTPSPELVVEVITEGEGPELGATDLFSSHYLGQIWNGNIFDQSFESGTPLTIGLGSLVQGWQQGLAGLKMGSRVLLSIPPHLGYPGGNIQAGIGAEDTLVFVVDLLEIVADQGDPDATVTAAAADTSATVTGELGGPAGISIPADTPEPTELTTTVLATGSGPVVDLYFYAQYAALSWDGQTSESTWTASVGPQMLYTTHPFFIDFVGIPEGSRVLVEIPSSQDVPEAVAFVVDITYVPQD